MAILSTDAIVRKPVVVALPDGSEGIAIHPVGNLAMSWDHRAFDGAYAANFLLPDQDDAGDPRLGSGALTAPLTGPLRVRWLGRVALRRGPRPAARRSSTTVTTSTCCSSSTRPSTRSASGPRRTTSSSTRSTSAPTLVWTDRGGDVTYHGPGQLVGYPILTLPPKRGTGSGLADTVAYVQSVEQVVIDALADLGLPGCGRLRGYPGVWVDPEGEHPRKIAAIGVRLSRGRTMHGFALNVSTDLSMFGHIIPCGIVGKAVTSLQAEGLDVTLQQVGRRGRACGPPARGVAAPSSGRTWPGGTVRMTCRPSPGAPGRVRSCATRRST